MFGCLDAQKLEHNSHAAVLHMCADFIIDEEQNYWFIGAVDVVRLGLPNYLRMLLIRTI